MKGKTSTSQKGP